MIDFLFRLSATGINKFFLLGFAKIATKHLLPELAGSRLTPKLSIRVAEAFVSKYGKYAGWAQTLLFIADLPSQKAILPPLCLTARDSKTID